MMAPNTITIEPITIVGVRFDLRTERRIIRPRKRRSRLETSRLHNPPLSWLYTNKQMMPQRLNPDKTSHRIGIPAVNVPPSSFNPPTSGTIKIKTTKPEINSRKFTATSVSIIAPPKLEKTPSSPQQTAQSMHK